MAFLKGIGVVSAAGSGREDFRSSLESGNTPSGPEGFLVDLKLADKADLKNLRRADRFSKLSVLAAKDALRDAGIVSDGGGVEAGVILCTGLGPHPTTFKFLDDIIEYGDNAVSPTTFSNSVHNAAASYIAAECGIAGPTITVTQFFHSFHEGLRLGIAWLREGRLRRVMIGVVDVHGDVLGYVASRMLRPSADGMLRPFEMKAAKGKHAPGEGAVFWVLEDSPEGAICSVDMEAGFGAAPSNGDSHLLLIDSDGLIKDESAYLGLIPEGMAVASYASCYGSIMSGSAFNASAGALILREKKLFPSPSADANPHGLMIADGGAPLPSLIEVLRLDCAGRRGIIRLGAM